jgi:hypothetical protein
MTATTITEYELDTVKANVPAASQAMTDSEATSPQGTEAIARVWEKRASYGGQYATAGADIAKFNVVALTHLRTYVSLIEEAPSLDGTFNLPMTADIEGSCCNASSTVLGTPYTAVDLNIASIGTQAPFPT